MMVAGHLQCCFSSLYLILDSDGYIVQKAALSIGDRIEPHRLTFRLV